MEPSLVLKTASVLLLVAALGGVVMALIRFGGQPRPPSWLAMVHGLLASAALTLLIYAAATVGLPSLALLGLIVLALAAGGGLVLNLNYHVKDIELPKWLVIVHALVAAVGFVLLLMAAFG